MLFTEIDVAVCVIILVTMASGVLRGSLRDFFTTFNWLAAGAATYYFYPYTMTQIEGSFDNELLGNIIAVTLLYIAAFMLVTIISRGVIASLSGFQPGMVDRVFGLFFGFAKGVAIVSIIHYMFLLANNGEAPEWLTKGETYVVTSQGAAWIDNQLQDVIGGAGERLDEQAEAVEEVYDSVVEEGEMLTEEITQE